MLQITVINSYELRLSQRFNLPQKFSNAALFLVAVLLTFLFLYLISLLLPHLPEPIGSRAAMFAVGTKITILLSVGAGTLGLGLGLILGLAKLSINLWLRNFARIYIIVLRGTPLLTQILLVYYVLPLCIPGLKLDDFNSVLLALALNIGAYNAEVVRGGILAVPKEQYESGLSLGLSRYQVMRRIILPQAFRSMLPALVNNFVSLTKNSSLASSIGLLELSLAGTRIISETFQPLPVLATVSIIYLIFTSLLSIIAYYFEKTKMY
jgi:polar amino acid transport system permease protein